MKFKALRPTIFALVFFFSLGLLAFTLGFQRGGGGQQPPRNTMNTPHNGPSWPEVKRLIDEQKFNEALDLVAKIREKARVDGDTEGWKKGLVLEVQLRTGLHGYETAVRFLKDQPWPEGSNDRVILELFYAASLVHYYQGYSWEINQRERVASTGAVDLKAWTKDQIFAEARQSYEKVWADRAELGTRQVESLGEYVVPNDYPDGIRDTVRDAVAYLYAELLADSSFWTPEQENNLYQLRLDELLADAKAERAGESNQAHPLERMAAVLKDLEAWHAKASRPEAALEARLERSRRLHAAFTKGEDRAQIRGSLEKLLPTYRRYPWWSMGQSTLVQMVKEEPAPGKLIRALALARAGHDAHPESVGGKRCLFEVKAIQDSEFNFTAMQTDGPQKRSIQVSHRNLPTLHFRAYLIDRRPTVSMRARGWLTPSDEELETLLKSARPTATWSADLPATRDYESHTTYVTPPLAEPGWYAIFASERPDFRKTDNRVEVADFIVSDLVMLVRRNWSEREVEVQLLSGSTGQPVVGARVEVYAHNWNSGHQLARTGQTAGDGTARFLDLGDGSYFLIASHGSHLSVEKRGLYAADQGTRPTFSCLIYTDRSIYRPNQRLLWKILAYHATAEGTNFSQVVNNTVRVALRDANGQEVDSKSVTTNEFGTAAGEFVLPSGRMLGNWSIVTRLYGDASSSSVKVEEYKRPTFEASLKEPEGALRLNRPATLKGEARYYFGLPVTSGEVKWRVTRRAVYPWWWSWYYGGGGASEQVVARGVSALKDDGSFEIAFTPAADEREAKKDRRITYQYAVRADVTDEGGETQGADRSFRLGFITVEGRIVPEKQFFTEDSPIKIRLVRIDLNGTGRAGNAAWRLVSVRQPEVTALPADIPLVRPAELDQFATPGDKLKPRWDASYSPAAVLRSMPDGREISRGDVIHNQGGAAELDLPGAPPGVYRLHYETRDDFGELFQASMEFIVAAPTSQVALPGVLYCENPSVKVGEKVHLLLTSGLNDQPMFFERYRSGQLIERKKLTSGKDRSLIDIPIRESDRGGFAVRLVLVRDHQLVSQETNIHVPWDNKELSVQFSTFRDKLRPGGRETWRVTVQRPGGGEVGAKAAEVLAYMYDRSLDAFVPHSPRSPLSLWPLRAQAAGLMANLAPGSSRWLYSEHGIGSPPSLRDDRLQFLDSYGIGGPGSGGRGVYAMRVSGAVNAAAPPPPMAAPGPAVAGKMVARDSMRLESEEKAYADSAAPSAPTPLRTNFSETAFWKPQLLTGADGSVAIEFEAPDSVTSWNVWVHAVTKDLLAGSTSREARTVKDLMVRPYMSRFLREGDRAELKVVVNNAGEKDLAGDVTLDIIDPETNQSLLMAFGLEGGTASKKFSVKPGGGTNVVFPVFAPPRVGMVAFKVVAKSGSISDGEQRPLPLLPGRMHLSQSRFVSLKDQDRRELVFQELKAGGDPSLLNEQMVVTVDTQLFYSVLSALPYLVNYPYECTEQTLNRFLSTGILGSVYARYPAVARIAEELSKRDTVFETFDAVDSNRKMALEETPWLVEAKGGSAGENEPLRVLDPRVAAAERNQALAKLKKAQTASGGFPWWPGGPPSPYMTLYIMYGFAKASEFGVDVPRDVIAKGWGYLAEEFRREYVQRMIKDDCCWEFLTFLNYVTSCYPDASWMGDALTPAERKQILDFSFKHWKQHSPYLKCQLSLTLKRMSRAKDAELVFASVMDSAKTTRDEGTYWAPEDRSWLWYNDRIETHAFALRTLIEILPQDSRKDGLVHWLFLNKKLNHWKSTKATAEVIYSLVHYLNREGGLGVREDATVRVGTRVTRLVFEPDKFTGKKNQIVVRGEELQPSQDSTVVVEKTSKGLAFASATWHFSTEKLPESEQGDLLSVSRRYFKRESTPSGFELKPLAEGALLALGDEIEVQLSVRAKHPCEYVHLRDPRAAGLEPGVVVSRYKWDLGIGWYEETRDSGTNFFFEWLPQGEYTLKYRVRANMGGTFRVSPATLQSMYAPEFTAYSAGAVIRVGGGGKPETD